MSQAAVPAAAGSDDSAAHNEPIEQTTEVRSGKPVRVTIPERGINLYIKDGRYDAATATWSLDNSHAMFAISTVRPNNKMGLTFIYGHGTPAVLGKIGTNPPRIGAKAKIYTNNHLVFSYVLKSIRNLKPDNTKILMDNVRSGSPRLVIQTCTGLYSQWRTMFLFSFKNVSKI